MTLRPTTSHVTRRLFALVSLVCLMAGSTAAADSAEPRRAVLITGTTSGIGLRMTEVLSKSGFFIYAGVRTPEEQRRLDALPNVKAVRLDVTKPSEIQAAAAFVKAEGRGLFGLINNAGVSVMGPMIETPETDLDFQLDVNLFGPYRVTKAFADLLIESKGRILNVSSIAGIVSGPFGGAYSISKHGLEAYTDTLAVELGQFDVQVAAVEPGNYKSQIVASMVKRMKANGYAAENSKYGSMLDLISGPLDRSQYEEPDDVAQAALDFLTSDSPKRRYMVVPNQFEAAITIRQALQEVVQLNEGHAYSYSRDELVQMLDDALGESQISPGQSTAAASGKSLHDSAMEGDLKAVQQLIRSGADLDEKEPLGGSSPLIVAATFGYAQIAQALIDAGADINQQNNDGSTALHTAALFCRTEIVKALLDKGADKTVRNNMGATALELVSGPFDSMKGTYDFIGALLKPLGLELDYQRIAATRPKIAMLLR